MMHTVEDVLTAAERKSLSLTGEQAEELLTKSPGSLQIRDVSVFWDDEEGELVIHANPQCKPQLRPTKVRPRGDLSSRLKKVTKVIQSSESPSPEPPKP